MIQLTRESTVEQVFDAYLELTGDEQLKELRDREYALISASTSRT